MISGKKYSSGVGWGLLPLYDLGRFFAALMRYRKHQLGSAGFAVRCKSAVALAVRLPQEQWQNRPASKQEMKTWVSRQ
jgi:hypothetical protein